MVKFYIATRLNRMKAHNVLRDFLVQQGHQITYDWTLYGSQKEVSIEKLIQTGEREVEAVQQADVVLVLLPGGCGTHTELGMALAHSKPLLLHSETEAPFVLGEATCAFYHCRAASQLVGPLEECLPTILDFVTKSTPIASS